jgi:hypothetical protein
MPVSQTQKKGEFTITPERSQAIANQGAIRKIAEGLMRTILTLRTFLTCFLAVVYTSHEEVNKIINTTRLETTASMAISKGRRIRGQGMRPLWNC